MAASSAEFITEGMSSIKQLIDDMPSVMNSAEEAEAAAAAAVQATLTELARPEKVVFIPLLM